MRAFLFLLAVLTACTVPDKASLNVMRQTRKLRKSPVTLKAYKSGEVTHDKLELRKNNSFAFQSNILGTQKCVFYAGTFAKNGDTLLLSFHNNYKDSLWTGAAVIDTLNKEITLISKNPASDNKMTITKLK